MKKLLVLFAGIIMAFSFVACNEDPTTTATTRTQSGETTQSTTSGSSATTGTNVITCGEGFTLVGDKCIANSTEDFAPEILGAQDQTITFGDAFDPLDGVSALDAEDGDLTDEITINGSYDADTVGVYTIIYIVEDSAGNEARVTVNITVEDLEGCPIHYERVGDECVKIPADEIVIMHGAVYEIRHPFPVFWILNGLKHPHLRKKPFHRLP